LSASLAGAAYGSTVEIEGASGVESVDARPEGDSAEAIILRRALECAPMTMEEPPDH
jgi:hypothetical protein